MLAVLLLLVLFETGVLLVFMLGIVLLSDFSVAGVVLLFILLGVGVGETVLLGNDALEEVL